MSASATEPPIAPDRSGQVLADRYRLQTRLAAGGMGEVYAAKHTEIPRYFAIKLMHPEFARDAQLLARFKHEAQAAASLLSDHVVEIADFGYAADGSPFIAMELLDGVDLRCAMQRKRLSFSEAVQIVIQACRGVSAAHRLSIVHRDLKPENLFLAQRGQRTVVKVLDFGVAKLRNQTLGTERGHIIGTPQYMAPEQLRASAEVDERADVYALGIVLYELLAGQMAHPGSSLHEVLTHILFEEPEPLSEVNRAIPPELSALVHKACARSVEARFQTAEDLARALEPFAGDDALPTLAVQSSTQDTLPALDSAIEFTPLPGPIQPARAASSSRAHWRAKTTLGGFAGLCLIGAYVSLELASRPPSRRGATSELRAESLAKTARDAADVEDNLICLQRVAGAGAAMSLGQAGSRALSVPATPNEPAGAATRPGARVRRPPSPQPKAAAEPTSAAVPEPAAQNPTEPTMIEVQRGQQTIRFKRQNPLRGD